MNNLIKKGIITATAVSTAATGFLGSAAFAQEIDAPKVDRPSIAERIAERFNLNLEEVKTFFTELKQQRKEKKQEKRGEKIQERLRTAVANGELTEDQAQRILSKLQELKAEHEGLRDQLKEMTPEDKREFMQAKKDRIQTWADENDIDAKWLKPGKHNKRGKGQFKKQRRGNENNQRRPQFQRFQSFHNSSQS